MCLFFYKDLNKSVIRNLIIVFSIPEYEVQFVQGAVTGSNEFRSSVHLVGGTGQSTHVISGSLSPRHGASSGCGWRNGLRYGG